MREGKLLSQPDPPMVLMVGVGSFICFLFMNGPSNQQFSMLMNDPTAIQESIKKVIIVA